MVSTEFHVTLFLRCYLISPFTNSTKAKFVHLNFRRSPVCVCVCVCVYVCVCVLAHATVNEKEKSRGPFTIFPEEKSIIHFIYILMAQKSTYLENKTIRKGSFTAKPVQASL